VKRAICSLLGLAVWSVLEISAIGSPKASDVAAGGVAAGRGRDATRREAKLGYAAQVIDALFTERVVA
jgi:hypothetical protein